MFPYPRARRSSTSVDSPPPTSMTEAEQSRSRLFYQRERSLKVRTVPADCVRGFLCVDLLPMGLCVHTDQCPRVMDSCLVIGPS